jgi:hypothetical protein
MRKRPSLPAEKPFEDEAEPNATLATPPQQASIVPASLRVRSRSQANIAFPPSADLLIYSRFDLSRPGMPPHP